MPPSLRIPPIDSTAGDEHAGGSRSSGVSHSALIKATKKNDYGKLKIWQRKKIHVIFFGYFKSMDYLCEVYSNIARLVCLSVVWSLGGNL